MRYVALGIVLLLIASAVRAGGPFVYPQKGQSADQQSQDEYECYKWARAQSGVDPKTGPPQVGGPGSRERAGGTVGGAARGAALGAAVGAIGGNAGKGAAAGAVVGGAAGRRGAINREQQAAAQAGSAYDRAFAACMDARGYSVR